MRKFTKGASYIDDVSKVQEIRLTQPKKMFSISSMNIIKKKATRKKVFSKFVSAIAMTGAAVFLFTSVAGGLTTHAFADADEDKKIVSDAGKDWLGEDVTNIGDLNKKFSKEKTSVGSGQVEGFGYLIERILMPGYINDVSDGASKHGNPGRACDVGDPKSGTPIYHNCDIPNLAGEFAQDIVSVFTQSGMINAETTKNQVPLGFGIPSNSPKKGAPVDPSKRTDKYTGLELYGYNLKYQSYYGEWDHIKVNTAARAMANMGFFEQVGVTGKAVLTGLDAGLKAGTKQFIKGFESGNMWEMLTSPFAYFEGAVTGTIKSIMDSSDLNVLQTYGWYRIDYGSRIYNAREISKAELAALAQNSLANMLVSQDSIGDVSLRPELAAIEGGPDDFKKAISLCEIDGIKQGEGITEAACKSISENMEPAGKVKWSKDGAGKEESLDAWKKRHADMFEAAKTNGMNVKTDATGSKAAVVSAIRGAWSAEWKKAADSALKTDQDKRSAEWLKNVMKPGVFTDFVKNNQSENFNAPWARYICIDSAGNDLVINDNEKIRAFDENGKRNPACGEVRPPVQNGLFGNGYEKDQKLPGLDTRHPGTFNPISSFTKNLGDMIGNFSLQITMFLTQVSNTAINLAFSPIMEELGLTKVAVSIIEGFRDGIFFPLVVLVIAIAGLTTLYQAGKTRAYGKQAISLLIMLCIFVMGIFLMSKPEQTIKAVDKVPSMIEQAIVGLIFSSGNSTDDYLCTATGTVNSGVTNKDLQGKTLKYTPQDGTRSLMCENWRIFAFNPWVFGQWGTNFENLYAENTSYPERMSNKNTSLVGSADVNMGAGITMNNWAVYQLDKSSTGTAAFVDTKSDNGAISRDMYRIVDMQAGPNNGKLSDGSHFETWSGDQFGLRQSVGFLSNISAGFGAVTIIAYSFTKLVISFTTTVMLMFLPLFLLMGLHPTVGRGKLKQYFGTLLGLIFQRIVLVVLLAVMLRLLTAVALSTDNYFISTFTTVAVCVIFMIYRKEILDQIFNSVASMTGGAIGQRFLENPMQTMKESVGQGNNPGYISNKLQAVKAGSVGAAGGFIGGMAMGQRGKELFDSANETRKERSNQMKARQRSSGIGGLQSIEQGVGIGKREAEKEFQKSDSRTSAYDAALHKNRANQSEIDQYKKDKRAWGQAQDLLKEELKADGIENPVVKFVDEANGKEYYQDIRGGERFYAPEAPVSDTAKGTRRIRVETRKIVKEEALLRDEESERLEENPDWTGSALRDESEYGKKQAIIDNSRDTIVKADRQTFAEHELKEALNDLRKWGKK